MSTAREKFLAVLANGPIVIADAVVVLLGEDAVKRLDVGVQLMAQQGMALHNVKQLYAGDNPPDTPMDSYTARLIAGYAPQLVLSGGIEDPPRRRGAKAMEKKLVGNDYGVSPARIYSDYEAMNTREQAVNLVAHAQSKGWKRALLVASPYHMPRAFLTVLKAITEAEATESLHVIPVTAAQALWWACPDGMTTTRLDLYSVEMTKIREHREHVATWTEGLDYLKYWEAEMVKPVEVEDVHSEAD